MEDPVPPSCTLGRGRKITLASYQFPETLGTSYCRFCDSVPKAGNVGRCRACEGLVCCDCYFENDTVCPHCKSADSEIVEGFAEKDIKVLSSAIMYCPNRPSGCKRKGKFDQLFDHTKICSRGTEFCKKCEKWVFRYDSKNHANLCRGQLGRGNPARAAGDAQAGDEMEDDDGDDDDATVVAQFRPRPDTEAGQRGTLIPNVADNQRIRALEIRLAKQEETINAAKISELQELVSALQGSILSLATRCNEITHQQNARLAGLNNRMNIFVHSSVENDQGLQARVATSEGKVGDLDRRLKELREAQERMGEQVQNVTLEFQKTPLPREGPQDGDGELGKQIEQLREETKGLKQEIQASQARIETGIDRMKEVEKDVEKLRSASFDFDGSRSEDRLNDLETRIGRSNLSIEDSRLKMDELSNSMRSEINRLGNRQRGEFDRLVEDFRRLRSELDRLRDSPERLKELQAKLDQFKSQTPELEKLRKEVDKLAEGFGTRGVAIDQKFTDVRGRVDEFAAELREQTTRVTGATNDGLKKTAEELRRYTERGLEEAKWAATRTSAKLDFYYRILAGPLGVWEVERARLEPLFAAGQGAQQGWCSDKLFSDKSLSGKRFWGFVHYRNQGEGFTFAVGVADGEAGREGREIKIGLLPAGPDQPPPQGIPVKVGQVIPFRREDLQNYLSGGVYRFAAWSQ